MELDFKKCTLAKLDKLFNLKQIRDSSTMQAWLEGQADITEIEQTILKRYRQILQRHGHDWNEVELQQQFIGPLFTLVNFSSEAFSLFAERSFEGIVDGIKLKGKPDGMIASGFREPEQPYFCFQEYKRQTDPDGDPAGQVLAAMLVAQELNDHQNPIYGCYIIGQFWYFIVLTDKTYCVSPPYTASLDGIFDIFRLLKVLKGVIERLVG